MSPSLFLQKSFFADSLLFTGASLSAPKVFFPLKRATCYQRSIQGSHLPRMPCGNTISQRPKEPESLSAIPGQILTY
jgi:hypothetical protein